MHRRRISKGVIKRVISTLLISLVVIGGCIINSNNKKIDNLEKELYVKQQVEQRATDYTESALDIKSIKAEFNKLNSYKILDGTINMKHKYMYSDDFMLGLKKQGTLTASANVYYEYMINLSDAEITVTNEKTLSVTLPKPVLNESSIHRQRDSFYMIEDETSNNFLMNDKDGRKIQQYWEDSFDEMALKEVKEYYSMNDKEDYLKSITKKEIKSLLDTLGFDDLDIKVKIM